jgi:hypothetical protein
LDELKLEFSSSRAQVAHYNTFVEHLRLKQNATGAAGWVISGKGHGQVNQT